MASILINASNIKAGGGIQVTQSICEQLHRFRKHHFIVVLSLFIKDDGIASCENLEIFYYTIKHNFRTVFLGRDVFLDSLVERFQVKAVLTVFGPSIWRPQVPHLCGFARAQLLLDNPLHKRLSWKEMIVYRLWKWGFVRSSNTFYTENHFISDMLPQLLGDVKVFTVTNYYNQVFDQLERWQPRRLPSFNGVTLLTLANSYPHKNLEIAASIARILIKRYPTFSFRFVFSIDRQQYHADILGIENHFVFLGKVDITECPFLYEQCDIAFQPSLLECFSAMYPEAMRMERPIVTTDLEFAHGLCGDAACYYPAGDAEVAAESIYKVATDKAYSSSLVSNGKEQLKAYDNYEQRAEKLVKILEELLK